MIKDYPFKVKRIQYDEDVFGFEVSFNDVPDVIGCGETQDEAINEAFENLDVFLAYCNDEGISIPEPSIEKDLDEYSGKITIRLPKYLHRDLSNFAEDDGMSINSIVNDAIRYYLNSISLDKCRDNAIDKIYEVLDEASNKISSLKTFDYNQERSTFLGRTYSNKPLN